MRFDIKQALATATLDRTMRRDALAALAEALPRLAEDDFDKTVLHVSDLGSCAHAVAQRLRGLEGPVDWQTQRAKFDDGQIAGAYNAALAKVAIQAANPDIECRLEYACSYSGLSGHIDLSLWRGDACLQCVEFKLSHFGGAIEEPTHVRQPSGDSNIAHVLQVSAYALAVYAPIATVVPYQPSAPGYDFKAKKRIDPEYFEQFDYDPQEWRLKVDSNVARLKGALAFASSCDAPQSWMPRLCRAAECPKRPKNGQPKDVTPKALEPA